MTVSQTNLPAVPDDKSLEDHAQSLPGTLAGDVLEEEFR